MPKKPKTPPDHATVFFATNRARLSDGFGKDSEEGAEKQRQLWLGQATVELAGDPMATEDERRLLTSPDIAGADDFADADKGSCARVLDAWLADAAARQALPLLFLHGFSNSFSSALQRAAQIAEFYAGGGLNLAPLAFSWPSDGQVIDPNGFSNPIAGAIAQYRLDQRDATAAGPALARLLREIWRARQRAAKGGKAPPRLALLAHSMGNHALASGLAVMNNGLLTKEQQGLFADAVLASPDVPATSFEPGEPLRLLPLLADRVTVGISVDSTLSIASEIANQNNRLGHSGPVNLANLPQGVLVVDYFTGLDFDTRDRVLAKGGSEWDVVQHQWYRNDLKARGDFCAILRGDPIGHALLAADQQIDPRSRRTRHCSFG